MPGNSPYRVVIIGAGFGGIGMGIALRRAGIRYFVIVDKGDGPGGPGGTTPIPAPPATCPRICTRSRSGRGAGVAASRRSGRSSPTCVTWPRSTISARICAWPQVSPRAGSTTPLALWNAEPRQRRHDPGECRGLRVGQLNRPALPDIPGLDAFTGSSWHSARWDHDADLAGKTVAVVGTGASAIQFVPEIAPKVAAAHRLPAHAALDVPEADRPYGDANSGFYGRLPVDARQAGSIVPLARRSESASIFASRRLLGRRSATAARSACAARGRRPGAARALAPTTRSAASAS